MKKNKTNITTEELVSPSGLRITAEIANPERLGDSAEEKCRLPAESGQDVLSTLKSKGRSYKNLSWNELFKGDIVNRMFLEYKVGPLGLSPFIPDPDNPGKSITMWVCVTDENTGRTAENVIVRESFGALMTVLFVAITCTELCDKRGHKYTVSTLNGTKDFFEDFTRRVCEDAPEETRNMFAFLGGLLESTVKYKAASAEKVLKLINETLL